MMTMKAKKENAGAGAARWMAQRNKKFRSRHSLHCHHLALWNQHKRPRPQTAQVLPRKFHNARTNEVVQEEAGGLLYALLFVLF